MMILVFIIIGGGGGGGDDDYYYDDASTSTSTPICELLELLIELFLTLMVLLSPITMLLINECTTYRWWRQ